MKHNLADKDRKVALEMLPMEGVITTKATIYAKTVDAAKAAAAYYKSVSKPGMKIDDRIDRALYLHRQFDAEARHDIIT